MGKLRPCWDRHTLRRSRTDVLARGCGGLPDKRTASAALGIEAGTTDADERKYPMEETYRSRWIACDDCGCSTVIERDTDEGVPDEAEWEEFGQCLVCGSAQLHWNADERVVADRYYALGVKRGRATAEATP